MRRTAWILAAVALVAVLVVGVIQGSGQTEEAQDFDLAEARQTLAGAPGPLAALHARANVIEPGGDLRSYEAMLRQLKGYPVVVNGWATWCGPCKLEFPIFQRVSTRLGREVAFLGVNSGDNRAAAERFLRTTPVPFPHLEDPGSRMARELGAPNAFPATIFIDRRGRRTVHQGGYTSEADLLADIRRYALA
jgi:cytochrome c biogenesis protein CcmG, thiol:disulfide interchange protein DsbE